MKSAIFAAACFFAENATAGNFDGAYVGGSLAGRKATDNHYSPHWLSDGRAFNLDQKSIGIFGGYNFQLDSALFGMEMSAQSDLGSRDVYRASSSFSRSTPYLESWMWSSTPIHASAGTRFENTGERLLSSAVTFRSEIKETAAPMISGRAGFIAGDFLFYGKAGLGFSLMKISETTVDNQKTCSDTISRIDFQPNYEQRTVVACINPRSEQQGSKVSTSTIAPTYAAAIGVEYNFDRVFARVETEARRVQWGSDFLPGGDNGTTRYQVNLGIGVRF